MYAKLLLRRNNMKRPSEMRRSFILRPNPWCESRQHSNRADHLPELFLQARIPAGTLKTFVVIFFASIIVKRARLRLVFQGFWRFGQRKKPKQNKNISNFYSLTNQLAKICEQL